MKHATQCPHCGKIIVADDGAGLTQELHHYIRTHNARTGQGVPTHHIFLWLRSRAPAQSHGELIDLMLKAGMLRVENTVGGITYYARDHDKGI